ncbi:MAG: hypothetical protein LUG62_05515 [Clostridiales bacterium]|nr:hypothetical protein [Clostridiales bacterium]
MLYALYYPQTKESNDRKEAPETGVPESGALSVYGAFQFTVERMRHYHGAWHSLTVILFPDYLFLDCGKDRAEELKEKQLPLFPMPEEVSKLLWELCGKQHHIPMSRGVIRDGVTKVTEGPLMGHEERIVRIDRHKRLAWLKVSESAPRDFRKESTSLLIAGLEITEKE